MEKRLSFASYAKCLKEAMKPLYNGQLKITQLLLEYLIIPDEDNMECHACNKEGELIFVDKVMASNLFNNKEERLLYGKSSEECGKMGILRNFMVFRWCLNIYDTASSYKMIDNIFNSNKSLIPVLIQLGSFCETMKKSL